MAFRPTTHRLDAERPLGHRNRHAAPTLAGEANPFSKSVYAGPLHRSGG